VPAAGDILIGDGGERKHDSSIRCGRLAERHSGEALDGMPQAGSGTTSSTLVHLGKADLKYIVKTTSDGIDPAAVTYSEAINEPVCDLYDVILIVERKS
jgi:hypothetical protein